MTPKLRVSPPTTLAAAGVAASGLAAGLLAEHRLVRRSVRRRDGSPPLPALSGLREERVRSAGADGAAVELAVYENRPPSAADDLTVVFVHGYTVSAECWAVQLHDLAGPGGAGARLIAYDQRGHGRSSSGDPAGNTIEQLGSDLAEVLRQRVPAGRVVLVGHSMGGMTIMALAEQCPELFGNRIVAVALVGTSSGGMAQVTLGLPALLAAPIGRMLPAAPRAAALNRRAERFRAADSDLSRVVNRQVAFAAHASSACLAAMARMQAPVTLETMAAFLPTFATHDRFAALAALKGVPTLILVGELDVLTPPDHSRVMADALPGAQFVTVPGSGHMVMMEAPDVVTEHLRGLIDRVS